MRRNTSSSWVLSLIKVELSCVSCTIFSSDTIVMIRSDYCVTVVFGLNEKKNWPLAHRNF